MASSLQPSINGDKNNDHDSSFLYATNLVSSSVLLMALDAVMAAGVFDVIEKAGPQAKLSPSEIAAGLPTSNPNAPVMLDRILRLLASHGVVGCSLSAAADERLYSLNAVSKYFVPNQSGVSLRPFMALGQDKAVMDGLGQLKDAILEGGIPFNRANGVDVFEHAAKNPSFNQAYNDGLYNYTTLLMQKLLESYQGFKDLNCLVDVGGGLGIALGIITSKYPSVKGINFDLPHVIKHAPSYPGVKHIGGDMFKNVPEGDAILLKSVLHDWSDDQCIKILKNCYKAIPRGGKIIVVETILPILPDSSATTKVSFKLDVIMLSQFLEGKERTREEYITLAAQAGFSGTRFENCANCDLWVMEFLK